MGRIGESYLERVERFVSEVSVYPVCCEQLSNERSDFDWVDEVLRGGAKIVQLRDKVSKDSILLEKAYYFREKTRKAGALFIINDRLDIALLSDADGIHVGQGDLAPEEIRKLAPDMIVGLSCNSLEQVKILGKKAKEIENLVSYYNIGPIYPTGTKEGLKEFLGAKRIKEFSNECSLPFTVMGGIKYKHIEELTDNGATRIAVVTAISQAESIVTETSKWIEQISRY